MGCKVCRTPVLDVPGMNPDLAANETRVPGGDYPDASNRINEVDMGEHRERFYGVLRPHRQAVHGLHQFTNPNANTPLAIQMQITVTAGTETRTITITPETGLVR